MTIYIINFVLNMLMGFFLVTGKNTTVKRKKWYLFLTFVQLGLLCGFRGTSVGWDTSIDGYYQIFDFVSVSEWSEIFKNNLSVETGFYALCYVIKMFGGDYQILLIVCALFTMGSTCIFIYRHSKNVLLSVFLIMSFPFYYTSYDIIRHYLAVSFFLLAFKYIEKRNFMKYLIFILIGSLFHTVAILFIPIYFIKYIKWNMIVSLFALFFTIFVMIYIEDIFSIINKLIGKNENSVYWVGGNAGGIRTVIMYFVIFLITVLLYNNISNRTEADNRSVNYVLLLFLTSLIFVTARMMLRLMIVFIPLMAIAIPQLACKRSDIIHNKNKIIYLSGIVIIGLMYHTFMLLNNWQNIIPYVPFWKG